MRAPPSGSRRKILKRLDSGENRRWNCESRNDPVNLFSTEIARTHASQRARKTHVMSLGMHSSFYSLSNSALHNSLTRLASEERRITLDILHHFRECEKRRLYAERGHPSLFDYAVRELGYSEGSAQRRISAMRALRDLPELASKLESGELKVTQVAQIQSFLRAEKKSGHEYSVAAKQELFKEAQGRSSRETEKLLAMKSPETFQAMRAERTRVVATHEKVFTQVSILADEELSGLVEQIKDRFAHQLPVNAGWGDVVRFLAKSALARTPENRVDVRAAKSGRATECTAATATATAAAAMSAATASAGGGAPAEQEGPAHTEKTPSPSRSSCPTKVTSHASAGGEAQLKPQATRFIPITTKRKVWARDQGRCQFVSATGQVCGSRHRLQLDHKHPHSLGGTTEPHNLQILCSAHNRWKGARFAPPPVPQSA